MRKNLPQRAPGYPYFDTSRDHIGSSPHMSSSLCGTCTACCCSDLYTHTKRRETRFIGLLSWCKQFHFCFGLKYVTFSKKWHDDKMHMICFHCGQSVSIRSRSSIQKKCQTPLPVLPRFVSVSLRLCVLSPVSQVATLLFPPRFRPRWVTSALRCWWSHSAAL